jgi:hypothetical protein
MHQTGPEAGARRTPAIAVVAFVGARQGAIDDDPVLEVDLVIRESDRPDRPLATSLRVPAARADRLAAGDELLVALSPDDPHVLDVAWDEPR